MLVTTTPVLPGRRYRELGVVVASSPPTRDGQSSSYIVNGYLNALRLLIAQAEQSGCHAIIGLHATIVSNGDALLAGTAVQFEDVQPIPPPQGVPYRIDSPHIWDFLSQWTEDL